MSQSFVENKEPMIVVSGPCSPGLAAALVMSMAVPCYMHPDDMPFDPPLSRLPEEPTIKKTAGDRERLIKAVEKRERKRLKALRDMVR